MEVARSTLPAPDSNNMESFLRSALSCRQQNPVIGPAQTSYLILVKKQHIFRTISKIWTCFCFSNMSNSESCQISEVVSKLFLKSAIDPMLDTVGSY